jgi:hypothetical protein
MGGVEGFGKGMGLRLRGGSINITVSFLVQGGRYPQTTLKLCVICRKIQLEI